MSNFFSIAALEKIDIHPEVLCNTRKRKQRNPNAPEAGFGLHLAIPTIEDTVPEESHFIEHVLDSSIVVNAESRAIIEHKPPDPRTSIVYPNQVKLPPGWEWIDGNDTECSKIIKSGSKMVALKTIEIQGSSIRCLVKGVEVSLDSLSSMFQSLEDLQQIFWNFENLKLCPGVVNPLLLKIVGTAKCGIKKKNYWRSNGCLRLSNKGMCTNCFKLSDSLKKRLTRMERLAERKKRLASRCKLLNKKLGRRDAALMVI